MYQSGDRALCAAVLELAVLDWRRAYAQDEEDSDRILKLKGSRRGMTRELAAFACCIGFDSARDELLAFFRSGWCEYLFAAVSGAVDYSRAMSAIGVKIN